MYFFSGCGLAIFVALASYNMKNTEHLPIQEIFKNRSGALLLMGMAVLIAPLVEETVFRGYLYPIFAKSLGVLPGILITGVLFGLMHGSQLGWTWGLVLLLTFVGVNFYFCARAYGHGFSQLSFAPGIQLHDRGFFDHCDEGFSAHTDQAVTV